MKREILAASSFQSPIGNIRICATKKGICSIDLAANTCDSTLLPSPLTERCRRALEEYFAGRRQRFSLPLDLCGSAFQKEIWQALTRVPFGRTVTYGDLARKVGSPKGAHAAGGGRMSAQAVGGAVGRNPISILIPCHRVIGADGSLTGFGPGIAAKCTLLRLEGHEIPKSADARTKIR